MDKLFGAPIIGTIAVEKLGLFYYIDATGVIYSVPMDIHGAPILDGGQIGIVGPYFDDGVEITFLGPARAFATAKG